VSDIRPTVVAALENLLRASNPDAWVVFADRATGKSVEFAGSALQPFLFDLPSRALNGEEMNRARVFFGQRGVEPEPTGFSIDLGWDVEAAADLALGVFTEVYLLPRDFEPEVRENVVPAETCPGRDA
jgi:hypothetical protein